MAITKISSALIGANTIATANIADNAIDGTKIAQNSILTKHIDDAQITTGHIVDANVTTAKIADDAVTLAKLAGLARGKIIYGDSSGNPAALALGSNGQVLKSDGTDIAWATDATVAALTTEEVQDIAGAMFSSNTETGITATYQDGDGTIDLVVGTLNQDTTGNAATATTAGTVTTAAQTNITSLGTLTTLTVDDITINGSTISDAGALDITSGADFTVDSAADINLDAGGGDWRLKDDGTTICTISNVSGDLQLLLGTQDKDFKFQGDDGGAQITALTLDMSDAGSAIFNHDVVLGDNGRVLLGSGSDLQLVHDGSNSYIDDAGTGILYVRGNDKIILGKHTGETMVEANVDGTVELYYDNAKKLETTSTGATTTGLHTSTTSANISQVAITSSSNAVAWDARAAANAYHVTTENTTFSAPSNAVEGAIISVELAQGGTARTVAWNTVFEFAASTAPTVTATANKTDIFAFRYNGSVWQEIGRVQNMAQT